MAIENSIVTIHRIPDLFVNSGTDWVSICSFILTALIVAVGAYATIKSHEKTIGSQEGVAAIDFLKRSRQMWINDLRDTCSDFVAAILNVQRLNNLQEGRKSYWEELRIQDAAEYSRVLAEWTSDHVDAMKEVGRLKAKIQLLVNPDEIDAKQLLSAVDDALGKCDTSGNSAAAPCKLIVENCQIILKQEWERVKIGK